MKDRIALGLLSGFLANVPKAVFNEVTYQHGGETDRFVDVVGGMFLTHKQARTPSGRLLSTFYDFGISSILGIPLVYLLTASGRDYGWLKGIVIGALGFAGLRKSAVDRLLGYPEDVKSNALFSLASIIWGVSAANLALALAHPHLFPQHSQGGAKPHGHAIQAKRQRIPHAAAQGSNHPRG